MDDCESCLILFLGNYFGSYTGEIKLKKYKYKKRDKKKKNITGEKYYTEVKKGTPIYISLRSNPVFSLLKS